MVAVSVAVQSGASLTWPRWQRLVDEVEALGFAGLYRSDHLPGRAPDLEMIVSLTYLASRTRRIEFGPLVSPISFRDPRQLVRQAAAIDDLSGGRLYLGLGAGAHSHLGGSRFSTVLLPDRYMALVAETADVAVDWDTLPPGVEG